MRKPGKCVHFNGTVNDCCKAGVNYKELAGSEPGWALRLPCGIKKPAMPFEPDKHPIDMVLCSKFQEPTPEEIAEDKAAMDAAMERHRKVAPLTIAMKEKYREKVNGRHKYRSGCEDFACPACGTGTLRIAISGYNGHTQGQCSTDGCVSWIE